MYIVKTLASDIHPLQAPPPHTRCDARNSDLTFICRNAEAKVQIEIQDPQICLEFLRFVLHSAIVARNPDVNCSDNLQTEALGTSRSNL